jgi:acid phosphatase/tartrate-resistant acid phosphatase type 5
MRSGSLLLLLAAAEAKGPTLLQLADWGGDTDSDPTWPPQLLAEQGLSKVAWELDADSVLMLGDNFYDQGVSSVNSKRFKQTFENVYADYDFPEGLPFHIIAGNHDHWGNVQAQVDYTKIAPGGRWKFPSLWYKLDWAWTSDSGESRSLDILMIDTVNLAGLSSDECLGCALPEPSNLTMAADQWSWIEQQLSASTADFLWVAGHYPIYSAGSDGTTGKLVNKLLPLLKKHGAHYISGHDHMVEHIISDGVHQFLNGMGAECCYSNSNKDTVPDGMIQFIIYGHMGSNPHAQSGFTSMQFGDQAVNMTFHKEDGGLLYTYSVPSRSALYV